MLKDFLVRFNTRFGVVAQHPEVAYRPLEPDACLDSVLCFRHRRKVARDNTVKYRWRTLQLLPGMERPSYAGTVVEVLEGPDGHLAVRYQGEIIPSQEAPPRPGILRSFNGSSSHGSVPRLDLNGLGRRWEAILAALDADHTVDNGPVAVRKAAATPSRKPTSASDGEVERCAKGEAQGPVDSKCRPRTGHPSGHGEEVHGSCEPAHEAPSGRIGAVCYHR